MVDDGTRDAGGVVRFESDATGAGAERRLPDGKVFSIVKAAYVPGELEALLGDLGWIATVTLLTPSTYVLEARRLSRQVDGASGQGRVAHGYRL